MRVDGNSVFRSAARHSRLVRFLRFAIPAAILLVGGVIVAAIFFNPFARYDKLPNVDYKELSISSTSIRMEQPRVKGFTTDQRPYELIARTAIQDLTKLDVLTLQELGAKVELKDGQHIDITSINGVYDTKAEVLRLKNHITIKSSSGYEGRLSEAIVHVNGGNIVSESPVEVKLPNGMLNANRLEVRDNGAVIKFGGGVEMNLNQEQVRQMTPPAAPDTAEALPQPAPAASLNMPQRRGVASP
jgi:lipopolysaccharide export system protein LptC